MRKLQHRTLERRLRNIRAATLTDIDWLLQTDPDDKQHRTRIQRAADAANTQIDDALRARVYDGDGRGGNTDTHPERHALNNKTDNIHERMTRLLGALSLIEQTIGAARALAGELITSVEEHDRRHQSSVAAAVGRPGSGNCTNCVAWVPGISTDRLRAGRCEPCYRYWRDHEGNERPRELWAELGTRGTDTATDTRPV